MAVVPVVKAVAFPMHEEADIVDVAEVDIGNHQIDSSVGRAVDCSYVGAVPTCFAKCCWGA